MQSISASGDEFLLLFYITIKARRVAYFDIICYTSSEREAMQEQLKQNISDIYQEPLDVTNAKVVQIGRF